MSGATLSKLVKLGALLTSIAVITSFVVVATTLSGQLDALRTYAVNQCQLSKITRAALKDGFTAAAMASAPVPALSTRLLHDAAQFQSPHCALVAATLNPGAGIKK